MTIILFLFYLVSQPRDVTRCALWLSQPATPADVRAACGEIELEQYRARLVNLISGETWCEKNGTAVYSPATACELKGISLDNFRMEIVEHLPEMAVCSVKSVNNPPAASEITEQCGPENAALLTAGRLTMRYVSTLENRPETPRCQRAALPAGSGLFDQPVSAVELATHDDLQLLAAKLLWYGLVTPDCDGFSGIDPLTGYATACGMKSARVTVIKWQNRHDQAIYAAALKANVPARLLKRMLIAETQSWPLWDTGDAGEIGPFQVTDAALDTLLRYDADLVPAYISLGTSAQMDAVYLLKQTLLCDFCSVHQADQRLAENMDTYARILAAYYCQADQANWQAAAAAWNVKYKGIDG